MDDKDKISVKLEVDTKESEENISGLQKTLINFVSKIGQIGDAVANHLNKKLGAIQVNFNEAEFKQKYSKMLNQLSRVSLSNEQPVSKMFPEEGIKVIADGQDLKFEAITGYLTDTSSEFQKLIGLYDRLETAKTKEDFQSIIEDAEKLTDEVENSDEALEETTRHAGVLSTMFARIGKQIHRQVYYRIAYLLNPLNAIKKLTSYFLDVVDPRMGATFKNIGENLAEYLATSDVLKNIVKYILEIIYALQLAFNWVARLFGFKEIDLFKKSMKTAKQLQKMQAKMLAGFDEINNIGGNDSGEDKNPYSIGELFDKKGLENWKEDLLGLIKPLLVIAAIIAGIWLISKLITGVNPMDAMGKGIGKLASNIGTALEFIAVLGGLALALTAITELFKVLAENSEIAWDMVAQFSVIIAILVVAFMAITAVGPLAEGALIGIVAVVAAIVAVLFTLKATLPTITKAIGDLLKMLADAIVTILTPIFNFLVDIAEVIGDTIVRSIEAVGDIFKKTFEGMAILALAIGIAISLVIKQIGDTVEQVFNAIISFIERLGPAINKLVDNLIKAATKIFNFLTKGFETIVNNAVTAINWLFSPLRKVGNFVLEKVGLSDFKFDPISKLKGLTYLEVGTNYVPNDQLAYIHKGEAVIPKKFNDKEYFGGTNDETNSLLEELINKVDNLDFQPYTTVKDVGKAAVEYMKKTNRQLGRSVT